MNGYLGRPDDWDYTARRPSPHRAGRTSFYLGTDYDAGAGLYRTRSQGARPQPVINVINEQIGQHDVGPPPGYPQYPPGAYPGAYAAPDAYALEQEARRGRRLNDELAEELFDLKLDRRDRSRQRSRSRTHSSHSPPDGYYRHEVERLERERREKLDRERIAAEIEKKKRDEHAREKELEEHVREKMEREKREAKEKEDELYRRFLLKQKEEKEKKEREEKAHKEELEMEMRKRLAERGYSGREIENIVNDKKKETVSTSLTITKSSSKPVYSKIHKDYLSIETLKYFSIPFTYDEVSSRYHTVVTKTNSRQHDSDYFIILQEMDRHETNILFEHTKALRAGRLLIDAPKREKEYAFFRKKERSKSRRRGSGEWKSFGIIEYKK